jgi:hypothetical protein
LASELPLIRRPYQFSSVECGPHAISPWEEVLIMDFIRRVFNVPATETQTGIVLALCIFAMSVMSIVLVWQAQVIARQNAVIRMFESRFGS